MEFKKLFVLSILAFLGLALMFSVEISGNSASDKTQVHKG